MFECKVCKSKDERISDLKAQIEDLRSLTMPKYHSANTSLVAIEADAIMSGVQDQIKIDPRLLKEQEEIQSEAARLLSGQY